MGEQRDMTILRKIEITSNLVSFFCDQVDLISAKQGLKIHEGTVAYLGQMLAGFSRSEEYFIQPKDPQEKRLEFPTISLLWLEGLSSEFKEKVRAMKKVGDLALYTTGFFPERLKRRSVDMDYYMAIGERAYETAAHLRETHGSERALNCFFELAEKFPALSEILRELSDQTLLATEADQLLLYEKWLASNSPRIKRMLGENGILVSEKSKGRS
jgi:hypothetical protein